MIGLWQCKLRPAGGSEVPEQKAKGKPGALTFQLGMGL